MVRIPIITFAAICKMHLYRLKLLLTIYLYCNMTPCLFENNFVFFLPAYIFRQSSSKLFVFTPSKKNHNSFTTTRHVLHVLYILTCIYIYIHIYIYIYILLYLHFYMNLIKLIKYGKLRRNFLD